MVLLLLNNAIQMHRPGAKISVVIRYLPYARQDRVCGVGEAFSMEVFADVINSAKFFSVAVWDCHSDVGLKLVNNSLNITMAEIVSFFAQNNEDFAAALSESILVAPDAGSLAKVRRVADRFGTTVIHCDKQRVHNEVNTVVHGKVVPYSKFLIVDDICDGGRTFISTAKAIRLVCPTATFKLYITHGIFSYGLRPLFDAGIDEVFVANDIYLEETWTTHRAP